MLWASGASAQTAPLPSFNPVDSDGKATGILIVDGATVTLTGPLSNIATGLFDGGNTPTTYQDLLDAGRVVSGAEWIGAPRASVDALTRNILVPDAVTKGTRTVAVHDSTKLATLPSVTGATTVGVVKGVGDQQYIDLRLATVNASGGTLNVSLGNPSLPATDALNNRQGLAVKQSSLFYVNGTGSAASQLNWTSRNIIGLRANQTTASGDAGTALTGVATFGGTFTAFDGSQRTVQSVADQRAYNDFLIAQLLAGALEPERYVAEFNKGLTTATRGIVVSAAPAAGDDLLQPNGTNILVDAVGANATVRVASNAVLIGAQTQITAVMRATQGADIVNDGTVGHAGTGLGTVLMASGSGSSIANNGVLNVGFVQNEDGSINSVGGARVIGVQATGGSTFVNSGVLNVAAATASDGGVSTGAQVTTGTVGRNDGTINVGINGPAGGQGSFGVDMWDSQFVNNGVIYLGRGPQLQPSDVTPDVALSTNYTNKLVGLRSHWGGSAGNLQNAGQITIGSLTDGAVGIYAATTAAVTNTSTGTININGAASAVPRENVGMLALGARNLINAGVINLNGINGIGIKATDTVLGAVSEADEPTPVPEDGTPADPPSAGPGAPAVATSSGTINVAGGIGPTGLRNYGIWSQGAGSIVTLSGQVNLSGTGGIGVHARGAGKINITSTGSVNFLSGVNQIGYFSFGPGSVITNASTGTQDVSTADSTLFRIEAGSDFLGGTGGSVFGASGVDTTVFTVTGMDDASGIRSRFESGNATLVLGGERAQGVFVNGGATGLISAGATINLAGGSSIAGTVDGVRYDLNGAPQGAPDPNTALALAEGSLVQSTAAGVVGFIAQNQGRLANQGRIALDGAMSRGIIVRSAGVVDNQPAGVVHVANGTGVHVEGAGTTLSNAGLIRADDGVAAVHLVAGAGLTLGGDGDIVFGGLADGIRVDPGAAGLTVDGASIIALDTITGVPSSGAGINNAGEIAGISLANTVIDVGAGAGIRTATGLDPASTAVINVRGAGTGFAFETAQGGLASGNLVLGPGFDINVSGAGGTGILALTGGTVEVSSTVDVTHAAGGSTLVTGTASSSINRGALTSLSTSAPVVDLSNGNGTTFTNQGAISAVDIAHNAVAGSAGADTVNLVGGAVRGIVATMDGSDALNWSAGTLEGSLEMGAADDALVLSGVELATTYHVDGGAGADRLTLSGIVHRGGSFAADDLGKGVNLGQAWETIDFIGGTGFTLTDDLVLSASTVNIDAGSTLFAGGGVNPVVRGVGGSPVTVNNAGTIDLSNGGTGPSDTLSIEGTYAGQGGLLRLETIANEGGPNSVSDVLRTRTSEIGVGATAIDVLYPASNGALTVADGILLVDVDGPSAPGAFVLANRVIGGAYEYLLFQGGLASAGGDPNDGNWYLRNVTDQPVPPDPPPPPPPPVPPIPPPPIPPIPPPEPPVPPQPIIPIVRPEVGDYLANHRAAMDMFVHTLHDRLGEVDFAERQRDGDDHHGGAWARAQRDQFDSTTGAHQQVQASADTSLYQVGAELGRWDGHDRRLHYGVMAGYGESHTESASKLSGHRARGRVTGYAVGVYGTWYSSASEATGWYLDGWLQFGDFSEHVGGDRLPRERMDASAWVASIEAGWALELARGATIAWYLEPQVQAVHTDYDADDHIEVNGTSVEAGDTRGWITRLGARAYPRAIDTARNRVQPFAELNWWHAHEDVGVAFNNVTFGLGLSRDTYELKLGAQAELGAHWSGWAHLAMQDRGGDRHDVQGLMGLKYGW